MSKKHFRKVRLKRAKEEKVLKSQLKVDIGRFLTDAFYCTRANSEYSFIELLQDGHKGYNNMSNKELISKLEEWHYVLHKNVPEKDRIKFYAYPEEESVIKYGIFRYSEIENKTYSKQQEEVHNEFRDKAALLVGQVLDVIIGLEREDEEGHPSGKAYKRGLPVDDLDET